MSFFNLAEIPIYLENFLHIFRTAPYLCISPLWPLWSSPWLPLWLSVSLKFWELIISWRKSTRGCKQKEISMKESYLWSHRQIRSAVFNLFPESMAPYRAEVWLVLPESSVNQHSPTDLGEHDVSQTETRHHVSAFWSSLSDLWFLWLLKQLLCQRVACCLSCHTCLLRRKPMTSILFSSNLNS